MSQDTFDVNYFTDHEALSKAAVDLFCRTAHDKLQNKERFIVFLSGGNTPRRVYQLISQLKGELTQADWERIYFFQTDEWMDGKNNIMVKDTLFADRPDRNFYPMIPEIIDVNIAYEKAYKLAEEYTRVMADYIRENDGVIDFVFLGMGGKYYGQGHIMSVFPGDPLACDETIVARVADTQYFRRITCTPGLLLHAGDVILLVGDETKKDALDSLLRMKKDEINAPAFPVGILHKHPDLNRIHIFVDRLVNEESQLKIEIPCSIEGFMNYIVTIYPAHDDHVINSTYGHYHIAGYDCFELHYIVRGEVIYLLQKREWNKIDVIKKAYLCEVKTGQWIIIPPGYGHIIYNKEEKEVVIFNFVSCSVRHDYNAYKSLGGSCYIPRKIKGEFVFQRNPNYKVCDLEQLNTSELISQVICNGELSYTEYALLCAHCDRINRPELSNLLKIKNVKMYKIILHVIREINKSIRNESMELNSKISAEYIANEVAFLAKEYFHQWFCGIANITYLHFIKKIKIEKSKELLMNSEYGISTIACMLGFGDQAFFSNEFKKYTGLTPGEYRKTPNEKTDFKDQNSDIISGTLFDSSLHHAAISVHDIAESQEWFEAKLGFLVEKIIPSSTGEEGVVLLKKGTARIALLPDSKRTVINRIGNRTREGIQYISFSTRNLDKTVKELQDKGVCFVSETGESSDGCRYAFFKDCNDILYKICEV